MSSRNLSFTAIFLATFLGSLALVTNFQLATLSIAFVPIIFFSELIAFAMVYASMYHSENAAHDVGSDHH